MKCWSQLLLVKHLFGTHINISNHLCVNIHHHMFYLHFKLVHWYSSSLFSPRPVLKNKTKCDFNSQDSNSVANCKILSEIKNLYLNGSTPWVFTPFQREFHPHSKMETDLTTQPFCLSIQHKPENAFSWDRWRRRWRSMKTDQKDQW